MEGLSFRRNGAVEVGEKRVEQRYVVLKEEAKVEVALADAAAVEEDEVARGEVLDVAWLLRYQKVVEVNPHEPPVAHKNQVAVV